jgi:hypothetical protein
VHACWYEGKERKRGKQEEEGMGEGEGERISIYLSLYDSVILCFPLLRMLFVVGMGKNGKKTR